MRYVKNFKNYENTNESILIPMVGGAGAALFLLVLHALAYGFSKVSELISFVQFTRAASKLTPIYDKIKDDEKMKELVAKLGEYKNHLYFGEEEGENPNRKAAFKLRDGIYQRAKELLSETEYEVFISAAKTFEMGSKKPAAYFTDKESKFRGSL